MSARVLVVDDSPIFRIPLRAALAAAGFTVLVAESAEAAEELMGLHPVDVVVSDVSLPGMDGLALAQRHPDTPFVLMTGLPAVDRPAPPSVRACLEKPLDLGRLLHILRSTMNGEIHAGT